MAKVKLEYEYRGLKAIPSKWFDGVVIEHRYELYWYSGSEMVEESNVNKRIKELSVIVNDYGNKKYRNIKVAS
jgi:hypothetical protein